MSQFVEEFANLLEECMPNEAQLLFTKESDEVIEINASELISITAKYLTEFNAQYEQQLFECCKTTLNSIAMRCNPKGIILEYLEKIRRLDNDIKFYALLEALGICMMKMEDKCNAIEWYVNAIKSYIEGLPIPKNSSIYFGDEDITDCATNDRIINVYRQILLLVEPLVQETMEINSKLEDGSILGDYLLNLLISLCGKPFCYLSKDVSEEILYKEVTKKIITLASCLTGDLLRFLNVGSKRSTCKTIICREDKNKKDVKNTDTETDSPKYAENYLRCMIFESNNYIMNLAYANFYFHIITEQDHWKNVPQVYNSHYIFEMSAYFLKILLCEEKDISIYNGLIFMKDVIKRISCSSVDSSMLGLAIYFDLFELLIKVMIYYNNYTIRKKAVHIFQEYVKIFNIEAKYAVTLYLYEISKHPGVLSLLTSMVKSSIIACLDSTPRNSHLLKWNMELVSKKICCLPHGSSSDLVEISDEVISTLNLLRFLFIRDQYNDTGIWNITSTLHDVYLKPLREGIDLCKAHWKTKLKDLEQQKIHDYCTKIQDYNDMKKNHVEVTLTVGGEQLSNLPLSEKISVCFQAINGLEVMESILIRVNECIKYRPKMLEE